MKYAVLAIVVLVAFILSLGVVAEEKTSDKALLGGIVVVCLMIAAKLVF